MSDAGAESEGVHALISGLERTICERLDRIDASLRNIRSSVEETVKCPDVSEKTSAERQAEDVLQVISGQLERNRTSATVVTEELGMNGDAFLCSRSMQVRKSEKEAGVSLRPAWQEWLTVGIDQATVMLVNKRLGTRKHSSSQRLDDHSGLFPWYILLPNRPFRLAWDLMMSVLIAHDMAVVPVNMAFGVEGNFVSDLLFWPCLLFWTMDVPLTLLTAIYRKGKLETRMSRIAMHYLRTWCIIDVLVLGSSWFEVWGKLNNDGYLLGRIGKSFRVLRVVRTLRFIRVAKLRRIAQEFQDSILSEYHHIMLTVIKLILTIIWLNHFIACGWYAVGVNTATSDRGSWVSHYKLEGAKFDWQYFTSLHWSLTQFTPAGMEVSAKNTPERIYSVFVLLFAMVTFSSFVSSITAAMTQLRQLHGRHAANMTLLRRYLHSRGLPMDFTSRIMHCVEYRLGQQSKEVQEQEVQYLKFLSQPLKVELSLHISAPILKRHPFLQTFSDVGFEAMQQLCLEAVERILLSTQDTLFREGMPCKQMFFLVSGGLSYQFHMRGTNVESSQGFNDLSLAKLKQGDHCCEMTVWSPWVHRGTMKADEMSEVLALDVAAFAKITCYHDTVNRFSARYGRLFLDALVKQSLETGDDISDITVLPTFTTEEILERAGFKQAVVLRSFSKEVPSRMISGLNSSEYGSERVGRRSATTPDYASESRNPTPERMSSLATPERQTSPSPSQHTSRVEEL